MAENFSIQRTAESASSNQAGAGLEFSKIAEELNHSPDMELARGKKPAPEKKVESTEQALEKIASQLSSEIFRSAKEAEQGELMRNSASKKVDSSLTLIGESKIRVESIGEPKPIDLSGKDPVTVKPAFTEQAFASLVIKPLLHDLNKEKEIKQPIDVLLALDDKRQLAGKLTVNLSSFSVIEFPTFP